VKGAWFRPNIHQTESEAVKSEIAHPEDAQTVTIADRRRLPKKSGAGDAFNSESFKIFEK